MTHKYWWIMDYYNHLKTYTFGWCDDPNCRYAQEHEYRYDGQIFYKVTN